MFLNSELDWWVYILESISPWDSIPVVLLHENGTVVQSQWDKLIFFINISLFGSKEIKMATLKHTFVLSCCKVHTWSEGF